MVLNGQLFKLLVFGFVIAILILLVQEWFFSQFEFLILLFSEFELFELAFEHGRARVEQYLPAIHPSCFPDLIELIKQRRRQLVVAGRWLLCNPILELSKRQFRAQNPKVLHRLADQVLVFKFKLFSHQHSLSRRHVLPQMMSPFEETVRIRAGQEVLTKQFKFHQVRSIVFYV